MRRRCACSGLLVSGLLLVASLLVLTSQPLAAQTQNAPRLIDVTTLQQMNAIRWDLNGDGVADSQDNAANYAAAFATTCTAASCNGYELLNNLDFNTGSFGTRSDDLYWNAGAGWQPIGGENTGYDADFDGRGHVITGLYINRPSSDYVGLFGRISRGSVGTRLNRIQNLGLLDVDVTGRNRVGALTGWVSTNTVVATIYAAGGLVTGAEDVGGLVGLLNHDAIAVYASVAVSGTNNVGGLAGHSGGGASRELTASYAAGGVTGASNVGGLVGRRTDELTTVTASYWDTLASGQSASALGVGTDTASLQTPTTYSGIYAAWNVDVSGDGNADDPWRFGTSSEYPFLRVSEGENYDTDGDTLIEVATTSQLAAIRYDLGGAGIAGVSSANRAAYLAAFPFFDERRTCSGACTGYELSNDLDLSSVEPAPGPGWTPIGGGWTGTEIVGIVPESLRYNAVFEGHGHVIRNMRIQRTAGSSRYDFVGLFGALGVAGRIRSVGMENVSINAPESSAVAALAGFNYGKIAASYVVSGAVSGSSVVGGLVGAVERGIVVASYSDVAVHGDGQRVGGLAGFAAGEAIVRASYTIGKPTGGGNQRGGLMGWRDGRGVELQSSYFDSERSGESSCCGEGAPVTDTAPRSSAELRSPTAAEGIYAGWDRLNVDDTSSTVMGVLTLNDDAPWDFGNFLHYPVLVFGGDAGSRAARRASQQEAQPAVVLTPTLGGSETVSEGEAATYVVRLPGVLPAGMSASWDWSVGGTEIGAADFADTSRGSVVIAPGRSSESFSLTAAVDGVAELGEVFEVTMSNARLIGAPDDVTLEVPGTVARTTIAANELEQVTVAVAPAVVAEGTTATFTVSLSSGADRAVTVEYELAAVSEDLTAGDLGQATVIDRSGTIYVSVDALPVTGSITLDRGGTARVGVSVVDDEVEKESSERFRLRLTNCPNCGSVHLAEIGEPSSAEARIRSERGLVVAAGVYLEGAYSVATGDMGTFLNRALPRVQPYNVRPWNHAATTTVPRIEGAANANGMPSNVVDWMLLELRVVDTGSAPSAADPDSVPAGGVKAGLLLSDGSIAGVVEDATTTSAVLARQGVRFAVEIGSDKDVYLLLQHRNHLPILSARPLSAECGDLGADYCIDYREVGASADLYNRSCPMFRNNDRLFMITGDVNADGTIVSADAEFADEALRRAISLSLQATNNPDSFRILTFRGTAFYMPSANVSLDELLVSSDFDRVLTQLRRPSGLTRGMICRSSGQ